MADKKLDVRVYPIDDQKSNTKAFASVAIDDLVAIRGVRIIDSEKGLFIAMPQSKDKENKYHDIAFPLNGDLRNKINENLLNEYGRVSNLAPDQRNYDKPEINTANSIKAADIKFDIRVYPISEPQGNTKAFASVSLENTVAIRGIRVVDKEKEGLSVVMPQSKDKENRYHDIAFPLNGDLRKEIAKAILNEYKSPEKNVNKNSTLADGLRDGAAKAAEQSSMQRESAAKSSNMGVLE